MCTQRDAISIINRAVTLMSHGTLSTETRSQTDEPTNEKPNQYLFFCHAPNNIYVASFVLRFDDNNVPFFAI